MQQRATATLTILAAATVALIVAAAVGLVVVGHSSTPPTASPPVTPEQRQSSASDVVPLPAALRDAVQWTARELPRTAALQAPAAAAALLEQNGFTVTAADPTYVIRSDSPDDHNGVPIAEFTSGAQRVVVEQQLPNAQQINQQAPKDAAARRSAERELLANPHVWATSQARQILSAGGLDLRAASVLALLAGRKSIKVVAINVDPPERAAGLPARSVDITVPSDAARTVRESLSVAYQPASVRTMSDGVQRWTWPISAVPVTASQP